MKFKYIDSLRGLAVLAVIMVHCSQLGDSDHIPKKLMSIFSNGDKGVQLFFIASAFTLFLSLNYRNENSSKNFFIKRFFRIAPMYYFAICYYLLQEGFGARYWLGDINHISFINIFSNITFTHGFCPYWINSLVPGGWTIAVEMLFYCFVPFLFKMIKNINHAFYFVLISLVVRIIFNYFLFRTPLINSEYLWQSFLFFYFPNQLPVFSLGILLYFMIFNEKRIELNFIIPFLFSIFILLQLVGYDLFPKHFTFGVAFLLLAKALSQYEFKLFVNPVTVYLGKISFSMYLVHFAVIYWLNEFNFISYFSNDISSFQILNFITRYILIVVLTVIISTFFYNIIELPTQRIGKKLILNKISK